MEKAGNWKAINSQAIINNIESVFKNNDINKLNNPTYSFVANLSGFIAHYNLGGFQDNYRDLRSFAQNLLGACTKGEAYRLGEDRDFIKWYGVAYCQSEADAINGIRQVVLKYQNKITTKEEKRDEARLENLIKLATEIKNRNDKDLTRKFIASLEG